MKLETTELETLLGIVKEFSALSTRLETESTKMEEIHEQKKAIEKNLNEINEEIKTVREKEKEFTDVLVEKYGPFKFNLETFEIELIPKQ